MPADRAVTDRRRARSLYRDVLTEAERNVWAAAQECDGLDAEIALLRVKLRSALASSSGDMDTLLKGVRLLVQAVATRYRIGGRAQDDLYHSVVGVLEGIGAALQAPEPGDADGR